MTTEAGPIPIPSHRAAATDRPSPTLAPPMGREDKADVLAALRGSFGGRRTARHRVDRLGRPEAEAPERLWGWRTCDRCGRTIMLGETTVQWLGARAEEVCFECAGVPSDA